ncbi:unnamed protein product [Candidula unifasciata]|uniref:G-protein coupled receptors family 1 profile domain-containing protein n=1 Tax=Candidula unifasciata TaxID=100452 RepID=A0A8S4A543_9EUPU|nr:unnamed protein product [Candidula unifasciata]
MAVNNSSPGSSVGIIRELKDFGNGQVIVQNEILYYFLLVNLWGPGLAVCVFGIITNILNIIVFNKQGVRNTVNISLLGLATSDLGSQVTLLYTSISFLPAFAALDLPYVQYDVMYISAWCHIMFTRISAWITAYITLERCLCVTAPLRVKNLFTPTRTFLYLMFVYLIMLASVIPCFYTAKPSTIFDASRNKSLVGLTFPEDRGEIDNITFVTNNAIPNVSFFLVAICTAVLVINLRKKSKWRKQVTNTPTATAVSERDSKIVKMVVLISVVFIICYFPGTAAFVYVIMDSEMRFDGLHRNLCFAVFSVMFHLESINASFNIFIYLSLSSKFKSTLHEIMVLFKRSSSVKQTRK